MPFSPLPAGSTCGIISSGDGSCPPNGPRKDLNRSMKRIVCVFLALALLLCVVAAAEGRKVVPMGDGIDPEALADGIYPAAFAPADLADGVLRLTLYTRDCYDIVDIAELSIGDTITIAGEELEITSLERGNGIMINGGLTEGGYDLWPFDEDNCWRVVQEDDHATYTERCEALLPLADGVIFTDSWDIEKDALTVSGAQEVAEAIAQTDMDTFFCLNTTIRVEAGEIVEIDRVFIP